MKYKITHNKIYIICSILFSLFTVFGESYKKVDSWDYVFENLSRSIILFIIYFIIIFLFLYVLDYLFKQIQKSQKEVSKITTFIFDKHSFIMPLLIIFLCYLPFIIIKYPGTPGWDFYHYLNNYYKYDDVLTQHFPIIYVLISMKFIDFGNYIGNANIGLFLLTLVHTLCMLLAFATTFYYQKKWNTNYKFRYFLLFFYCLNPIFLHYSTTIYHDIIYSSLILVYVLLLTDIVKNDISKKKTIFLLIISLLITLTRKNGIFIIIPTTLFLLKYDLKIKKILLFLPIILFYLIGNYYSKTYIRTSILEAFTIPIQAIARYSRDFHDDISLEDKTRISRVIYYDVAGELYNPTLVDPVRNNLGYYYATNLEYMDFLVVVGKLFFKHPTVYIQSFINTTYQLYYPFEKTTYLFLKTKEESNYDTYINFEDPEIFKSIRNKLNEITYKYETIEPLHYIDDPGIYIWVFIFVSILFIKRKKNLLPLIPLFISFLCCLAGPAIDYHTRYVFPIIFSIFPLISFYYSQDKDVLLSENFIN